MFLNICFIILFLTKMRDYFFSHIYAQYHFQFYFEMITIFYYLFEINDKHTLTYQNPHFMKYLNI